MPIFGRAQLPLLFGALIAFGVSQAAPGKPAATQRWSFIEGDPGDGIPKCMLFGRADRSTTIQFMTDAGHYGSIAVGALNLNWSINEGDDLGEISFSAAGGRLTGKPVATDHAFFYFVPSEDVAAFFKSARSEVKIERNGEIIGRFQTADLPLMIAKLQSCGERLNARDPFAKPLERSSTERRTSGQAIEPVAILPKPIDLGKWIGLIQQDYLSGPHYEGAGTKLRHEERNSRPASVKFAMAVDERGHMTSCEILESSGYNEWNWLFCSLAKQYPLKFTPALSSSGKPIAGEYITTAVVAFK